MVEIIHQTNCKQSNLVTDYHTGEIACSNCGAVCSERIMYTGPENTGEYYNESRTGQKISLKMVDMGLSTIIESKDKDVTGRDLSSENKRMFYRLRMWDRNSRYAISTKSFQKAFILLDGMAGRLGLPEPIVEQTAHFFRKMSAMKILSGRSTTGALCAAIYITCRLTNTPRTLQDIADAGNIKKKNLQRIYRFIIKKMDITPEAYNPLEFVARIAKSIPVSEKTERRAIDILKIAQRNNITTSKNPVAMAAAAIHLAALINSENVSQIRVADVSGISAVTIRDRTREIQSVIGDDLIG